MEVAKTMQYSLNKTKYMVVKTGQKSEKEISEQVKTGNIQRTIKYKCSGGMAINKEANLKGQIGELKETCQAISMEIGTIGSKN